MIYLIDRDNTLEFSDTNGLPDEINQLLKTNNDIYILSWLDTLTLYK